MFFFCAQKFIFFSRCMKARINSWWRVIRLRRLIFVISWKITGKPMVVCHSKFTVLRCSSGMVGQVRFFQKTVNHLLGRHPYSRLLFNIGIIRVNLGFIINIFRSTALCFFFFNFSLNQSIRAFFMLFLQLSLSAAII